MLPSNAFTYDFELLEVRRKSMDELSDEEYYSDDAEEDDEEELQRTAVAVGGMTAASSAGSQPAVAPSQSFLPAVVPTVVPSCRTSLRTAESLLTTRRLQKQRYVEFCLLLLYRDKIN